MKVEIIKDDQGWAVGWSMQGENKEEIAKLATIRDLQFFGFDETGIDYAGRKESDDINGNPGILSWAQRGFTKPKQ
jgi:hypothetical protein